MKFDQYKKSVLKRNYEYELEEKYKIQQNKCLFV